MDTSSVAIAAPQSMEDVEKLIRMLYDTYLPASTYTDIQKHLVPLQRNAEGWRLAEYLLHRDDPNVKFFGANTYIIKMNSDWESLDEDSIRQLEERLIGWLLSLTSQPSPPQHVVKKLSTALALYYALGKGVDAEGAVKRLVCSKLRGEYLSKEQTEHFSTSNLAPMLDNDQLRLVLQFVDDLAVESRKLITGFPQDIITTCISRMSANLEDAVTVVQTSLFLGQTTPVAPDAARLCDQAMVSFYTLARFAQAAWSRESENIDLLRTLIEPALVYCTCSDGNEATQQFQELLEEFKTFFRPAHLDLIARLLDSTWAGERMEMVLQADPEAEPFLFLLASFGQAMLNQLLDHPDNEIIQRYMEKMHGVMAIGERPGIDEEAGPREGLIFWSDYLEQAMDRMANGSEGASPTWLPAAKTHVARVASTLWTKVCAPTPEQLRSINSDLLEIFKDFRRDVQDFCEEAYRFLGDEFLAESVQRCLRALSTESPDWYLLEAALFCVNALADEVPENSDPILDQVFSSPLFTTISHNQVPQWTCRTALDTVGQYSAYFQRHTDQLPSVFDFLLVALRSPVFAHGAASALYTLCDSCRVAIVSYLHRLFETYGNFVQWATADGNTHTKEKFIGGVTCIVQGLKSQTQQLEYLIGLLEYVKQDVAAMKSLIAESTTDDTETAAAKAELSQVRAFEALHSLRGIGRAMQAPNDEKHIVDLDGSPKEEIHTFWTTGEGTRAQQQILEMITVILSHHPENVEVVDLTCDILRAGFPESEPGPFVFPAATIVDFISLSALNKPGHMAIFAMAQALPHAYTEPRIDGALAVMLNHILSIIHALGDPRSEPEAAESLVQIVNSYLPRYTNVLMAVQPPEQLESLFRFVGMTLSVPEPLPKRAAASFWDTFLSTTPSPTTHPPLTQETLDHTTLHFAPSLATTIIHQITGQALRSDLDAFSKLLVKFLKRVPNAKAMLEQALEGVVAEKGMPAGWKGGEGRVFVQQLGVARSVLKVREVVGGFWMGWRGIEPGYVG